MTRHCVGGQPMWTTRVVLALTIAFGLLAAGAFAQDEPLTINDKQYFEKRGLNVLVFTNEYNGMFFDEKTAGIELIHHGVRTATGGAVRLSPTPEQWDQIPKVVDRKVDAKANTIEVTLRYDAFDFSSRLVATPDGAGFRIAVYLDNPVPAELEGRAGLNLEFVPSRYWERTYLMDGKPGVFPRYPAGPTASLPPEKKIRQFEGHSTFDLHGHTNYIEALPLVAGKTLLMAPDDPERFVTIRSLSGELQLHCFRKRSRLFGSTWRRSGSSLADRPPYQLPRRPPATHVLPVEQYSLHLPQPYPIPRPDRGGRHSQLPHPA